MDLQVQKRYLEKIEAINGVDPYSLDEKTASTNPEDLPECNLWTIGCYLVYETSHCTHEDFNEYKSLNAYNQFTCGWVRDVKTYKINDLHVVVGKVMHSQRVNEKPFQVWIIVAEHGVIQSAHCTCMVEVGEACAHIGAVLFLIESYATRFMSPPYWALNAAEEECMANDEDEEIDISTKELYEVNETKSPLKKRGTELSDKEFMDFLQKLSEIDTPSPPAILLVTKPFCEKYYRSDQKREGGAS